MRQFENNVTPPGEGEIEKQPLFAQNEDGELSEVGVLEMQDDRILGVTLTDHRAQQGQTFIRSE